MSYFIQVDFGHFSYDLEMGGGGRVYLNCDFYNMSREMQIDALADWISTLGRVIKQIEAIPTTEELKND